MEFQPTIWLPPTTSRTNEVPTGIVATQRATTIVFSSEQVEECFQQKPQIPTILPNSSNEDPIQIDGLLGGWISWELWITREAVKQNIASRSPLNWAESLIPCVDGQYVGALVYVASKSAIWIARNRAGAHALAQVLPCEEQGSKLLIQKCWRDMPTPKTMTPQASSHLNLVRGHAQRVLLSMMSAVQAGNEP